MVLGVYRTCDFNKQSAYINANQNEGSYCIVCRLMFCGLCRILCLHCTFSYTDHVA